VFGTFNISQLITRHKKLSKMKHKAKKYGQMIQTMLAQVQHEQSIRLKAIRNSGPWDSEWLQSQHQHHELAQQTVKDLAEYRETLESLKELEEQWGSINGWERLYYIDPWICTSLTFGVTIVILVFKTIH